MNSSRFRQLLYGLFCIQPDDKDLLRAQFEAFQNQMPLLYGILLINTAAVAYSFSRAAPVALAFWIPLGLCIICLVRLGMWVASRKRTASDASILKQLQMANKLSVVISLGFCSWALALFPYGDAYMKGHVAFYMALTEIAVIFCLMHLRSAALISTIVVLVPFCAFFFLTGVPSYRAIAVNLALVCGGMIVILFNYYRDFAAMVESRKALILKQAETQRLSDENFRIANLDSLTDLPNRRSFFADLVACEREARETAADFAIGIIDLDGFKPVNDTYGHAVGDMVLVAAGRRMQTFQDLSVSFARLGGDEFAVLLRDPRSDGDILQLGRLLCEAIQLPFHAGASTVTISCSIGFARFNEPSLTHEMLYERADYALYRAKRSGKRTARMFTMEHKCEIQKVHVIEQALMQADLSRELSLVFQPIIATADGHPVAFEALARWTSPTLGIVTPAVFIPTAERIGLIADITRILLQKALEVSKTWPDSIRLSFNLSVHDICSAEAALGIIALVNRSGVSPGRIDFEITETAVAHDFAQALETVVALRALGCGISLDDFGTGFSSLSHLHRLPLDKVKVDRSFVEQIITNPVSYNIVKSLIVLCRDMNLKCVIEGVETAEQESLLIRMGCDYVQGYHYSTPLTAEASADFIRARPNALRVFQH